VSPLTKLFVVLLVILSIAFVSGTIVALNQVDVNQTAIDTLRKQLNEAKQQNASLAEQVQTQTAIARATAADADHRVDDMTKANNALQMDVNDSKAQVADASSKMAIQSSDLTRVTEALKSSEDTKGKYADQIADLRKNSDNLLMQNGQLNASVTDLTSRLDVTERERKYLAEQLTQAKDTSDKLSKVIKDAGLNADVATAGTHGGAPAITGVIRDTQQIAGVPYATISVGANAQVTKGMEFSLVGGNGDFLGTLTVDTVEPDEAMGRLSGPKVSQVQAGVEAKTQL
jgi:septal ring factor EnvC (AmiA/AmiB activator)